MKNLVKGFICLSTFIFTCVISNAQKLPVREQDKNRPSLFQNLPDKISCSVNDLSALFELPTGRSASFNFNGNVDFHGVITSIGADSDNNLQSLTIRSTNFQGAVFSLTRTFKRDKSMSYAGCIISFQHKDAFEINQENGQYYFVKKNFYDIVNE